jgi:hypothetical protein
MVPMALVKFLKYYLLKAGKNLRNVISKVLESLIERLLFDNQTIILKLNSYRYAENYKKQLLLDNLTGDQKIIFFVFRDVHILDWFTPIHLALKQLYGGQYLVFYINFGSTLKQIGKGFNYLSYQMKIEKRLINSDIKEFIHFSQNHIPSFRNFPDPDMIVTSETIRQEHFKCNNRVYIPHYSVPKLKAVIPKNIIFNHMFQAVRPPFCYNEFLDGIKIDAKVHQVGYPKMHLKTQSKVKLFQSNHPIVIFAPSVESKIVMDAIKKGILDVFKQMEHLNFVIKLHPTLASSMNDVNRYVQKAIKNTSNIILDTQNNIQSIAPSSSVLINDFGSAGAEYKLSFGKRVIFLEVPNRLEGGADLRFRDQFADGISNIHNLEKVINNVIKMGDLDSQEWENICKKTLYAYKNADITAAKTIDQILNKKTE